MHYSLVACDLDGTLLDDQGNVSEENIKAINEISNKGIIPVLVTGRTYYEIPKALRRLESIRYIIYSDGAVVFDKMKGELYADYMDSVTAMEIFDLLSEYDTMIEIYESGTPKTDRQNIDAVLYEYYNIEPGYRNVISATRKGLEDIRMELAAFKKCEMYNVFFKNADERLHCQQQMKQFFNVNYTTSMDNNLEIMSKNVSKGRALEWLLEYLNISSNNVIGVGDSSNDFTMFASVGMPIAAGNADDGVKRVAGNVACTNNEHIAKYLLNTMLEV